MNRRLMVLFLVLCCAGPSFGIGVTANTGVTNTVMVSAAGITNAAADTNIVNVAGVYGISVVTSPSNHYYSPANVTVRIPVSFTNNANDADSNAQVMVQFLSNNAGYVGGTWSCYIELAGTNAGTNYSIPFADFGEGAVFSFNLVVQVPLVCPTGSSGFFSVDASTSSNSNHMAVVYSGVNGLSYGGYSNTTGLFEVEVYTGNAVASIEASDGVDTITVFNGSRGLRRSSQTVTLRMAAPPTNAIGVYFWYDIDNAADGPGGANTNDRSIRMNVLSDRTFNAIIPESSVQSGSALTFVFEVDGIVYAGGYNYLLLNVMNQGKYETILMHNIISRGSGENIYVKMPARLLGRNGKVQVYSVSGDLVMTLLDGRLDNQVIHWDGNDKDNTQVAKGLYFITVDFSDLKEVRKVFVK